MASAERLKRALSRSAAGAGLCISHAAERTRPWSSCSYVGARHSLTISAPAGGAVRAWLDGLDQDALRVPGHVLADLVVVSAEELDGRVVAALDALTIAEA